MVINKKTPNATKISIKLTPLVLFFILGILLGVALKTEAVKIVTMGYNDYKMKIMSQDFDVNKLQKDMLAKQMEAAKEEQKAGQEETGQSGTVGNAENNQDGNNQGIDNQQ